MNWNDNWLLPGVLAAIVIAFLVFQSAGQISAKDALAYLKQGALVIDVRSPGEFAAGHLAGAINVPLDQLEAALPQRVRDKNQVLLLHCASGTRSSLAKSKLRGMGYPNAFNLGSYGRAEGIVSQSN